MSWQKIRKRLRDLWVPEITKELDISIARYRKSGVWDDLRKVTFSYKKESVFIISDSEDWERCVKEFQMYRLYLNQDSELIKKADQLGYYDVDRFYLLTNEYINDLNIEKVFETNVLLFQIYAILDRRVGKRTLKKNMELIEANSILKNFYNIRINASK